MGPKHVRNAHFAWNTTTTSSLASIVCEAFRSEREASWTMARRRIAEGVFGGGNVVLPACSAWWERASEGLGTFVRNAMKKAGGSTRNGRDSNPKYLGIKKSAGSWIAPGNIIVRQRGTKFHPGEHVLIGKDHTLMALESGKVRFDRDKVTKRVFISVDVHAQRKTKKNLIPIAN